MEDLILELNARHIQFVVLPDGSIDCEDSPKLNTIEALQKYKVFAYVDNFETGSCRHHIEK